MDGQSYDPLLGGLKERLASRKESASTGVPPGRAEAGAVPASPSDETARDTSHALNLRDVAAGGWLYGIMSTTLSDELSPGAFVAYRDILLEETGNPSDPIEVMLVEQLALAHFSIGQLRIRSCSTESPKLAIAFADAAMRLLGEFRRCSLALEDYRAKQTARQERSANNAAEKTVPAARNGESLPSTNGKKKPPTTKQRGDTHTEMPKCLQKRMAPLAPNGSLLAAATSGNGKG